LSRLSARCGGAEQHAGCWQDYFNTGEKTQVKHLSIAIVVAAGMLSGCSSEGRLADLAEQVTHEQAAQNQRMADSTQAVAKGSQELVAADSQARNDLINLQRALRDDQAQIGKQLTTLEVERKDLARQRRYDSAIGNGLIALGLVCAALAPLLLAAVSLVGLWRAPTPEEEGNILIEELLENDTQPLDTPHQHLHRLDDSTASRT
jgi:outer membrane murein-binding lipoprotein Lpp